MIKIISVFVVFSSFFASCTEGKKNRETNKNLDQTESDTIELQSFLSKEDLEYDKNAYDYNAQALSEMISQSKEFFAVAPKGSESETECSGFDDAIVKSSAHALSFHATWDINSCRSVFSSDTSEVLVEEDGELSMYLFCKDEDLQSLNGKMVKELDDEVFDNSLCISSFQLRIQTTSNSKYSEKTVVRKGAYFIARTSSDLKQCKFKDLGDHKIEHQDCKEVMKVSGSVRNEDGAPLEKGWTNESVSYQSFDYSGLVRELTSRNGTFYDSGTLNFILDQWSGEMVYRGQAKPSWTANKGEEKASGSFDYQGGSLALSRLSTLKNLSLKIARFLD